MLQFWSVRLAVLSLAVFTFPASASAQSGSIAGAVVSAEGGRPVEGAEVVLGASVARVSTDVSGRFRLSNVPSGAQVLIIRASYTAAACSLKTSTSRTCARRAIRW